MSFQDKKVAPAMNCAFIDIQKNLLNVHFPQKETLDLLDDSERASLVLRSIFYLKIESLLFEYWQTLDDKCSFITDERIAWHYLIHKKKLNPSDVVNFDKQSVLFFLYEDVINTAMPGEVKNENTRLLSPLQGITPSEALPWNIDSEWVPGVMLSTYLQLSYDARLEIADL